MKQLDPRRILSRNRLDIVLKYLFFQSLAGAADRSQWEPFYRKHIMDRTRGIEPRDRFQQPGSTKTSVDDYVSACEALLPSLKSRGFDPACPVPVSSDQRLLNGAHRIACALATRQQIVIAPGQLGSTEAWGFQWFLDRAYPADLLAALLYHYARLTTRAMGVLILWGPTIQRWHQLTHGLKGQVGVVGWLDCSFERHPSAFGSVIHDIYSLQWPDLEQSHIRRKVILLNQSRRAFRVILIEDLFDRPAAFRKKLREIRGAIRVDFSRWIPEEAFCTCHASSSGQESKYLVEVLLGQGSRKHQLVRPLAQPRPEFGTWLFELAEALARNGLSRDDICIVGSSPLEVLGIRSATDIDITVASSFRKRFGAGITRLNDWLDIVTEGYPRSRHHPPITDDELIYDPRHHFWFRGFKFADIDIVLRRKAWQKRPKDLADVEKAKRYFAGGTLEKTRWMGADSPGHDLIGYLVGREPAIKGGRL